MNTCTNLIEVDSLEYTETVKFDPETDENYQEAMLKAKGFQPTVITIEEGVWDLL